MKKLLVLALVLSMATMASATLQISVNGEQEPIDSMIVIEEVPSGILTLDIWTTTPIGAPVGGEGYFAMLCSTAGGTIMGGAIANPDYWGCLIYDDAASSILVPEGDNGVFGGVFGNTSNQIIEGTIFDGIIFHCEGMGDVLITLYSLDGDTGELTGVLDHVIVHQIPEPMTMALLGLGGLFLRRRK